RPWLTFLADRLGIPEKEAQRHMRIFSQWSTLSDRASERGVPLSEMTRAEAYRLLMAPDEAEGTAGGERPPRPRPPRRRRPPAKTGPPVDLTHDLREALELVRRLSDTSASAPLVIDDPDALMKAAAALRTEAAKLFRRLVRATRGQ